MLLVASYYRNRNKLAWLEGRLYLPTQYFYLFSTRILFLVRLKQSIIHSPKKIDV